MIAPSRRFFTSREGPSAAKAAGPGTRCPRRSRPALEALESRCLLSIAVEDRVSTYSSDDTQSANASSANGTSVVVWVNDYQNNGDTNIYAQRFDKNGAKVGPVIQVDYTAAHSTEPSVAMDSTGRFVVTWINPNGTHRDVEMRYFDAVGTPRTEIARVNSNAVDNHPDVAASNGSFVITWSQRWTDSDHDIYAERFMIGPNGLSYAKGIFGVNTDYANEDYPSVAMSPSGAFDIAYMLWVTSSRSTIFMNQYDGAGVFLHGVTVNSDEFFKLQPDVAMDNAGNAVVVYPRYRLGVDLGIYANRVYSNGVRDPVITVRDDVGVSELDPSVALAPVSNQFVVAYMVGARASRSPRCPRPIIPRPCVSEARSMSRSPTRRSASTARNVTW